MVTLRQATQQVISLLEAEFMRRPEQKIHAAITALRQALADEQQAEPVAWVEKRWLKDLLGPKATWAAVWNTKRDPELIPLFTCQQPAQQPLTDEQILEKVVCATLAERSMFLRFARAIERAHGIKEAA